MTLSRAKSITFRRGVYRTVYTEKPANKVNQYGMRPVCDVRESYYGGGAPGARVASGFTHRRTPAPCTGARGAMRGACVPLALSSFVSCI
jgi:hypothetical protein